MLYHRVREVGLRIQNYSNYHNSKSAIVNITKKIASIKLSRTTIWHDIIWYISYVTYVHCPAWGPNFMEL